MIKTIALIFLLMVGTTFANWETDKISLATFAKTVENRIPVEAITEADNTLTKVYFWTNIRNSKGDRITHRWIYKGRVKAEISFDIKGNRWRVWSSKNLWHRWTGIWRVEVLNRAGKLLLTKEFIYKNQQ